MATDDTWGIAPGTAIAPGLVALDRLGGGSRYEAYLAWDERRGYEVVAKLPRPSHADDETTGRMLRREAELLERARHPVVVRLFDASFEPPRPFITMEHVEGPMLSTLVRRFGRLPLEQLLPLGQQLAAAVSYLHAVSLVHLDVKPRNIIMAGPPRLIDFSVARPVDEAAQLRSAVGTRTWMAPEQCAPGHTPVGPPADVWGIGTVLHLGASGQAPFPRDSDEEHPQLTASPAPLDRDVPGVVAELIGACLDPDPEGRPTATELRDRLEEMQDVLPGRMVLNRLRPGIRTA